MSIQSVISGSSSYPQTYSSTGTDQMKSEFDALASALQSGDLKAAQQAFATIQKHAPKHGQSSTDSSSSSATSGPGADFQALSKALQSGDLKAAQSAFDKLQKDRPQGPPPGGPPPSSDSSSADAASGSTLSITA